MKQIISIPRVETQRIGVQGAIGSGKTLLITVMGYGLARENPDWHVYANYNISFGKKINPIELLSFDLENSVVLLTEAHTFLDSRTSSSVSNRLFSYFITQTGKRNMYILFDTQMLTMVDYRLHRLSDKFITAYKTSKAFVYDCVDVYGQRFIFSIPFKQAQQIFKLNLYDTREIVYPLALPQSETIDFNQILYIFEKTSNNKTVFIATVRKLYPFLLRDSITACFYYLKLGDMDLARKVLL